jgi:hypothetical protein
MEPNDDIRSLLRDLTGGRTAVRMHAARRLVAAGEPAVRPLLAAYRPGSVLIERMLVRIGTSAVVPLCEMLRSFQPLRRQAAARLLGEIGDPAALTPLAAALEDREPRVRERAAEALGRLGPEALAPLTRALRDPAPRVRASAAAALGHTGDARAVEHLAASLEDGSHAVCAEAAQALGRLAGQAPAITIRAVLPRLRRLQSLQDPGTARALWIAARRIDTATAHLKDVPIPASAAEPRADQLPLPARSPTPALEALPVPAAPRDEQSSEEQRTTVRLTDDA